MWVLRRSAALATVGVLVYGSAATAGAIEPPVVPPGAAPTDSDPAPDQPMHQVAGCVRTAVLPGPDLHELPAALQMMDMPAAWRESTGAGVVVGVIDTGVAAQPRLPHLVAGGDYVMGRYGDGLSDCDAHGTVVASLIGAAPAGPPLPPRPVGVAPAAPPAGAPAPLPVPPPAPPPTVTVTATPPPPPPPPPPAPEGEPDAPAWGPAPAVELPHRPQRPPADPAPAGPDGLVGIAPDAVLISVRQSAQTFGLVEPAAADNYQEVRRAGDINSLARAIVHVANLGAKVINISVMSCIPVAKPVDQTALGEAVRYAAIDKDAVIVAAAGNAGEEGCSVQNPDPIHGSADPLGWDLVQTIATPGWFSDYVLTVSATDTMGVPLTGRAASLHGPWIGLAAPGADIVGLSTEGEVINAGVKPNGATDQIEPLAGSSFAAAFVSGAAALVRAKYPALSAHQVIRRLEATAHPPAEGRDNVIGYGVVDPVAALTWDVPAGEWLAPGVQAALEVPPPPPAPDRRPPLGAAVFAVLAALGVTVTGWVVASRRRS